ncbi:MAG: Vms1/Ankzf1 family peptidyl-tRNA hydrolase [Halobacteriales archaeon]
MFDSLFGRAELKERITELEAKVESLEEQLAAEQGRRAEAVEERQESQERANRLEDRIADLEGQLKRAREGERVIEFRGTAELRGDRLAEVLDRLSSVRTAPEGALSAMVDGSAPEPVREHLGERAALVNRAEPCLVFLDDAGVVSAAVQPALAPPAFAEWGDRFRVDREWFLPTGEFGLALVRSDLFAYGAYEGRERVDVEGFGSDLKGEHSKGGYSQARFERRRDEQIEDHLADCRAVLEERDPERLIVVGERTVITEFAGIADEVATVDATGDPEAALADAFDSFFTATLYLL